MRLDEWRELRGLRVGEILLYKYNAYAYSKDDKTSVWLVVKVGKGREGFWGFGSFVESGRLRRYYFRGLDFEGLRRVG